MSESGPVWTDEDVHTFMRDAGCFRSRRTVNARRLEGETPWVTSSGSLLHARAGDWLLSDGETVWTVAAEVFDVTYERQEPGRYRKVAHVRARRFANSALIETLEGIVQAEANDWLVRNPEGDVWPVPAEQFESRYEACADETRRMP